MSKNLLGMIRSITREGGRLHKNYKSYWRHQPSRQTTAVGELAEQMAHCEPRRILTTHSLRVGRRLINKRNQHLRAKRELDEAYKVLKEVEADPRKVPEGLRRKLWAALEAPPPMQMNEVIKRDHAKYIKARFRSSIYKNPKR